MKNLNEILLSVEKPSRYTGGEYGSPKIKWEKFNYCICFPDVYEVAMSNLGIRIVAEVINGVEGATCDRCFAPWPDFGRALKENGLLLYSLGLKKPLKEFDMLGFSLQYEMSYTTVLYMLDLAGIPLLSKDRGEEYPLIQGGGPCVCNPEPLADFFDLFVIGDGEESMARLAKCKLSTKSKEEFLLKASEIEGVYVPKFMQVEYNSDGTIKGFSGKTQIKKAVCIDLEHAVAVKTQAVANIEAVHDRGVIEVMRGCYRSCRFCQAGFFYRPVRFKSVDRLVNDACEIMRSTGFENISLSSLSTGDYPELKRLIAELKEKLPPMTKLSLPSMRVDSFEEAYAEESRKNSLTFAPEAGTQRLRDVINKDITEEEIMLGAEKAFNMGFTAIKLYFMMGLPTETMEDLEGISDIVNKIKSVYGKNASKLRNLRVNVSVSTFIPKPFTPFAWERQVSREEVNEKIEFLKSKLYIKGVSFNWNDFELSEMEAVLARGDRRLGQVILKAFEKGCYYEGWNDYFKYDKWLEAFKEVGIDKSFYTREIGEGEILPWDFVDIGITKEFYLRERHAAYQGKVSGNCKQGCKGCGLKGRCNLV